jgi:hypothetical protein
MSVGIATAGFLLKNFLHVRTHTRHTAWKIQCLVFLEFVEIIPLTNYNVGLPRIA